MFAGGIQLGGAQFGITFPAGVGGYDPDAQAFFTAAGITSPTQKNAVNQLVIDLKAASIWTKILAIYPYVGGSASSNSFNLKNTAQFQITWSGAVTHNAIGITGDGATGFGDTGINVNTLTLASVHLSTYNQSAVVTQTAIGAFSVVDGILDLDYNGSTIFGDVNNLSSGRVAAAAPFDGFVCTTRRTLSDAEIYRNGISLGNKGDAVVASSFNANLFVLARNNAGITASFYAGGISVSSVGTGLTTVDVVAFNSAVQTYQTSLGRNV